MCLCSCYRCVQLQLCFVCQGKDVCVTGHVREKKDVCVCITGHMIVQYAYL